MMRAAVILLATIFGSLGAGLILCNVLVTGQVDPLSWLYPQLVAMLCLAYAVEMLVPHQRWTMLLCGAAGSLAAIATFCHLATRTWFVVELALLVGTTLLAIIVMMTLLRCKRYWPLLCLGLTALAAIVLFAGKAGHIPQYSARPNDRPPLAVMSALPLFWTAETDIGKRVDAPAITTLRAAYRVVPLDTLDSTQLGRFSYLLLAQPRLLTPGELVAFDQWVRDGGVAVILADPLLIWPMDLPVGDRRRPPLTSLLDPLLDHWGLRLEAADGVRVERRFLATGALLPVAGASRFVTARRDCSLPEGGLMALCAIGKGRVRLIADADMLDDRLWLADPAHPLSRSAQMSDTMTLLVAWLRAPRASPEPSPRPVAWLRDETALVAGLRCGGLVGIFWVVLGAALVRWRRRREATAASKQY